MRTGKLHGTTKVLIPYYDTEGARQFTMITIEGTIYASKLYAGIRKFVEDEFKILVDKDWLAHVPLIVNSNDPEVYVSPEEKDQMVEDFIDRMELKDDEIEDEPDSRSESQDASETGQQMCSVQNQSNPS